jgi:hypothetical protein
MKIIITESQFGILTENKATIDNLVKIIKLTQSDAELLYATAGKLSMWIAKKIKDKRIKSKIEKITGIIDWIRVGLNGNIQTIRNVDFDTLVEMQETWHKSLKSKEYDFDYDEKNKVILDFRDNDGIGYYWVRLNQNPCTEEAERMGHCGRSGKGVIYSLRVNELKTSGKVTNKSVATAAIKSGVVYQLKGRFNKKVESIYHEYIVKLLELKNQDGDYFIKSFGSEYQSGEDFRLTDLDFKKYADTIRKRIDLIISDEEIEQNEARIQGESIKGASREDCRRLAAFKFLSGKSGVDIASRQESLYFAKLINSIVNSSELSDSEFGEKINEYNDIKKSLIDEYNINFSHTEFTFYDDLEETNVTYTIYDEETARINALESIADSYNNQFDYILKEPYYTKLKRMGINFDKVIKMDNDEIYDFFSEMIYDSPKDYIDDRVLSSAQEKEIQEIKKELETATDEDRIDYLENEIEYINARPDEISEELIQAAIDSRYEVYENNPISFMNDYDFDKENYFNMDAFALEMFKIDQYATLSSYTGEWEEVYACDDTWIIFRTD